MSKKQLLGARCVTLLVSMGCMVAGVLRGEHLVVLKKAVRICLECIGIG